MVARRGQAQKHLQHHMDLRGLRQISPAHHIRDPLRRIVQHNGQMIGTLHVLPGQDHVPDTLYQIGGLHRHAVRATFAAGLFIGARRHPGHGRRHVEPQGDIGRARAAPHAAPAGAGIDQPVRPVGRHAFLGGAHRSLNVAPRAGAGIKQPARPEVVQRGPIGRQPVGLTHHRLRPVETQPAQVVVNLRLPCGARTGLVDILDP